MGYAPATLSGSSCGVTLESLTSSPEGREILTCIQCGVCAGTCPYGEVMQYPPRRMIAMLRAGLLEDVFRSDSLLACVACYACMAKCPRGIRLTEVLLPLMKEQALGHLTELPLELQKALQNTLRYGNPMGESSRKRAAWVKTAGVPVRIFAEDPRPADVLWFVECYTSYYPRGQDNTRATARLFHELGIDFAILGNEEKCAGECGRLTWEPGLFETLMDYNMAIFEKYKFGRLVTSCPHAHNAFRNRYVSLGFNHALEHTTPFLARHVDRLKPLLKKDPAIPGHLSRLLLPRPAERILRAATAAARQPSPACRLVEMTHNRVNSICCGGGGGGMWLDTYYKSKGYERLSERRVKEAVATQADVLAVSCPYEVSRFEDALKVLGHDKRMVVRDVTELLAESME